MLFPFFFFLVWLILILVASERLGVKGNHSLNMEVYFGDHCVFSFQSFVFTNTLDSEIRYQLWKMYEIMYPCSL